MVLKAPVRSKYLLSIFISGRLEARHEAFPSIIFANLSCYLCDNTVQFMLNLWLFAMDAIWRIKALALLFHLF